MDTSTEERPSHRARRPRGRWTRAALVVAALAAIAVPTALANHDFGDVPDTSPHHADISTIARVGITGGCTSELFCPGDAVTRQQMGSFLARTLRAVTPALFTGTASLGGIDPDAAPVFCQTPNVTPLVAARAFVTVWATLQQAGAGELGWTLEGVFSTDGGSSWTSLDASALNQTTSLTSAQWSNATNQSALLVNPGTTYRFGLRIGRASGSVDGSSGRCETSALVTYRDAGSSAVVP